jgi:quinol monooxygenase YgiN
MKYIVGFFTTKSGQRETYLSAAQDHLEKSRLDPDCLYIELVPMPDDPDRILLAEAFTSEEAHRRHEDTDHMRALWAVGPSLLSHVVIDNVISEQVEHIDERFD